MPRSAALLGPWDRSARSGASASLCAALDRPAAEDCVIRLMKIVHGYPPNLTAIKSVLNIDERYTLFTYGDTIYNPSGRYIPDHILVHEEIHAHQQCSFDGGAERFWSLYLTNASFRLDQESQAFRAQYAFVKKEISHS